MNNSRRQVLCCHYHILRAAIFLPILSILSSAVLASEAMPIVATQALPYFVSVGFPDPVIVDSHSGVTIDIAGCRTVQEPGKPILPVYTLTIPAPAGMHPDRVVVDSSGSRIFELDNQVPPGSQIIPLAIWQEPHPPALPDPAIYNDKSFYPDQNLSDYLNPRLGIKHGESFLSLSLYPVQYSPATGRLISHRQLAVSIKWKEYSLENRDGWRPSRVLDNQSRELRQASSPIFQRFKSHSGTKSIDEPSYSTLGAPPSLQAGTIDHVIVAPSNFIDELSGPWSLQSLSESRAQMGLSSTQVSLEWIVDSYPGRDVPEKIRSFVRDAYDTWQTRYLLIVGNHQLIPTRLLYASFKAGLTYTENIPADALYYGCLDGSFDSNQNNIFGEIGDGENGGEIDTLAEVHVGRFPVGNTNELANLIRKTLEYESLPSASLRKVLHVGEHLGFSGLSEYGSPAMEQIKNGAIGGPFASIGFNNSTIGHQFDLNSTLYDSEGYRFTPAEMLEKLNSSYHIINHLGHSSARDAFKIKLNNAEHLQALKNLTNTTPYFVYSQGCRIAAFDQPECFAEQFVNLTNGPFATLMNSRDGFGYESVSSGPSHLFHRKFWDSFFTHRAYNLGSLNTYARESLVDYLNAKNGNVYRYIYYEINLFGDPATPLAAALSDVPAKIVTEGLPDFCYPGQPLTVSADIGPAGLVVRESPRLFWRLSTDPADEWRTDSLSHTTRLTHEYTLPQQPLGTVIEYFISAESVAGLVTHWPNNDPKRTEITHPLSLTVGASPTPYGVTYPDYGAYTIASGTVINAEAPQRVLLSDTTSQYCLGCQGGGSAEDTTNNVNPFVLLKDTQLTWNWIDSYMLRQSSSIPGHLKKDSWHNHGEVVSTLQADAVWENKEEKYRFVDWWLNCLRQPSDIEPASQTITGITMTAPATAFARYLPSDLDSDQNGIADWYEYHYYGNLGLYGPQDDGDGDGFTTLEEFGDLTDPTDSESFPKPPDIAHSPLASPHAAPPPYQINATITDSHSVSQARLEWRVNHGDWVGTNMSALASNVYQATIIAETTFEDILEYQIVASDPGQRTATNGPHAVTTCYPIANLTPAAELNVHVPRHRGTTRDLNIANNGNTNLHWILLPAIYEPVAPEITNRWDLSAVNQPWQVSTNRSISTLYSLHGRARSAGSYNSPSVYAGMHTATFVPTTNTLLHFQYWIASEIDKDRPGYSFDGMIIEVSTNQGITYAQLEGAYTHRQTGWKYSPWPEDTPCFSGDGSQGWQTAEFDLSPYSGQETFLRFLYGGDNNSDGEGVYLDEIEIGPLGREVWSDWVSFSQTDGTNEPSTQTSTQLTFEGMAANTNQYRQHIALYSNDPTKPRQYTLLRVSHHPEPWLGTPQAWQSSSNGTGIVTIQAPLADEDGNPLTVHAGFIATNGAAFQALSLFYADTDYGPPLLDSMNSRIDRVPTSLYETPLTNTLTLKWGTQLHSPPLPPLMPQAQIVMVASNQWLGTTNTFSMPFMIDNDPPALDSPLSSTHAAGQWSRNLDFAASWPAACDGAGSGFSHYVVRLSEDSCDILLDAPPTTLTTITATVPESANLWLHVAAFDILGNRSHVQRSGPYKIDATPPSIDSAWVDAIRSEFGDYVVGPQLQALWGGFNDSLSGIQFYLLCLGSTKSAHQAFALGEQAPIRTDDLNATNTIIVRAVDFAGNVSHLVSNLVWVLDPDDDYDGDGYSNASEELAGTDATDASSILRLYIKPHTGGQRTVVTWFGHKGREYTLLHSPTLTPSSQWQPVSGWERYPGDGAIIHYLPPNDQPLGFYRLMVDLP